MGCSLVVERALVTLKDWVFIPSWTQCTEPCVTRRDVRELCNILSSYQLLLLCQGYSLIMDKRIRRISLYSSTIMVLSKFMEIHLKHSGISFIKSLTHTHVTISAFSHLGSNFTKPQVLPHTGLTGPGFNVFDRHTAKLQVLFPKWMSLLLLLE